MLRKLFLTTAAAMVLMSLSTLTRADIIYLPNESAPKGGVGHTPESILSIQSPGNTTAAAGGVSTVFKTDKKGNLSHDDNVFGDAKQGVHSKTLSFSDAGISNAGRLRIFMDTEDPDNDLLLDKLVLTAYKTDGTTIDFKLAAPVRFNDELNGQGKGDRVFALDSQQAAILQAAFQNDPNLRLGLLAATKDDTGSFTNFKLGEGNAAPVPEPTTMILLGTGLAGVAARARKRHQRAQN